jgi:hypothetical protein
VAVVAVAEAVKDVRRRGRHGVGLAGRGEGGLEQDRNLARHGVHDDMLQTWFSKFVFYWKDSLECRTRLDRGGRACGTTTVIT